MIIVFYKKIFSKMLIYYYLMRIQLFDNIFIQPAAGDAGGALGAALAAYYLYFEKDRNIFVAGGKNADTILSSVEKYDPKTDSWTIIKPLRKPCSGGYWFRCHTIGQNIYAIGGDKEASAIQKYDAVKDRWELIDVPVTDIAIWLSVTIPRI